MIGRLRTAVKFFTIGVALGILFAPEAGAKMREHLVTKILALMPGGRSEA